VNRREIEARARAEALVRDELARSGPLEAALAELEPQVGPARRLVAALAGSRLVGLLAGYGTAGRRSRGGSAAERRGGELRRRRFRLTRRKRVLDSGMTQPLRAAWARVRPTPIESGSGVATPPPGRPADASSLSFCIRIAGRDWGPAELGGDAALARSLARALSALGHEALVQIAAEADDPRAAETDVLLALRGRPAGEPSPGRVNLLWLISHPDEVQLEELERYDRVLVASRRYAERLRDVTRVAVEAMAQFTDPALFHPDPDASPRHELAFVGNWRGEFRRIVADAIEIGWPPALYGQGWDLLAPEHAVAEHVPHEELYRLYSSCAILLCDHWDDMRRLGFVSNKILDALACETFVIADENRGLAELLPGAVETYSGPAELGEKIGCYLGDPEARRSMAERGRSLVLAEHTVERRAEQLLEIVAATINERDRRAGGASAAAPARRGADTGRA